jgi:hypothetical protein
MTIKELINQKIDNLSNSEQKKVLDFVNILGQQQTKAENEEWNYFSLEEAMRDLENDNLPEYTQVDLIEKWQ